ncbi:MAG: GntR family transcriptional regulator [Lachnospiraceae bacterium]|nr:GntR family transcriptional regulator [Lachnospiraceae bacterium]
MIVIDYKDARPIYEQIVERFSELILKGVLTADSQMPSVRNLAMELSINPNTIQKAYMELERRGYTYSVKGRGIFIKDPKALLDERKKNCLMRIAEETREALGYGVTKKEIKDMVESI